MFWSYDCHQQTSITKVHRQNLLNIGVTHLAKLKETSEIPAEGQTFETKEC